MKDGSSSDKDGTQAVLLCSAQPGEPQSLLKYQWTSHGKIHHGPNLTISVKDTNDHEKYSCKLSNPLTAETATFTAKDCYSGRCQLYCMFINDIVEFEFFTFDI